MREIVERINDIQSDLIEDCMKERKKRGVTLAEIGKDLGYSTTTISRFEQGKNNSLQIALYYMTRFGIYPERRCVWR